MATANKRVVTDATGQAMVEELRKIPGIINPLPVEKGGTGATTSEKALEALGAQPKFNFDVEKELNNTVKTVNGEKPDSDGNVHVVRVASAENLVSEEAQVIKGIFIERNTAGFTPIKDENSNLGAIFGNSVRLGHTPEIRSFEVLPESRNDDDIVITAIIDWSIYKEAVNRVSTNKSFVYTTSWNENPETYGITVFGNPISGDTINVYFMAENRGTIVNATPTSFVEVGWNLYNHETGRARVLKYSDEYGFAVEGTYSALSFSPTVDGTQIVITPDSNGHFSIPEDGYVFVTGGNDTDTCIYMTWSDWLEGHGTVEFMPYTTNTIDFSSVLSAHFPYGLCAIGAVKDEINFNDQAAYIRIERLAYTLENLAIIEASSREYVCDTNWIYAVKAIPDRAIFSIDKVIPVYDHGMEYFTGTTVPVEVTQLFGQNLRDKLRTNVVTIGQQTLNDGQKEQVRANINAVAPVLVLTVSIVAGASSLVFYCDKVRSTMVVLRSFLSNKAAATSDITVETFDGYFMFSGTFGASTDITLYLIESATGVLEEPPESP